MSTPASIRDLYIDPSSAWTFLPSTSTPSPKANISQPNPSYQWSNRPSHNSIFDLSPSLDLTEPSGINVTHLFKTLVASAVLQYTSTAIAMPWEVGKLLLQVQWVPRDADEPDEPELIEDNDDALSDSSNDDSYFADPHTTSTARHTAPRPTDDQGYVIRRSVLEDGTRPEFIIPVGSADGVWGMMKRIGRFRGEGWLALWKGLLTSCIMEILSSTLEPPIHNFLQSLFLPTMSSFHHPPILLPVMSHIIAGFILSPLDLIRTRLIVQSFSPRYRSYSGPMDALSQILRDEGGLSGIYFHPHLFLPAIIDNTLRPVVSLALPSILAGYLGIQISEEVNPIAWGLAELGGSCLGLLITLPFETIRRRLQVQVRGTAKPLKGCVELRPAPYNGIVDTLWHILTEERSDLPIRRQRKRRGSQASLKGKERADTEYPDEENSTEEGWFRNTGIGQLYRGMGMRLGASAIVFILALLSGGEEGDGGWTEL